ncbi:MAG: extracellular solute-binding protein, partial [Bacillota bacterium]
MTSVAIDEGSIQSNFFIDDFNLDELQLEVSYDDESVETVAVGESMVSDDDFDKLSEPGAHTIEIVYEDVTTSLDMRLVETDLDIELLSIYEQGVSEGDIDGTYQEWRDSIKGEDGREVEFREDANRIQWRYTDEESWRTLVDFGTEDGESHELTLMHGHERYAFDVKEGTPLEEVVVDYAYLFEDYVHKDRHDAFFFNEDGSAYEEDTMPDEPLTLEVTFEAKVFTVFMHNANDALMETMDIAYGEDMTLPQYTKDNLNGIWYLDQERKSAMDIEKMPNQDLDLYLNFEETPVLDKVPEDDIELTVWTAFGDDNATLIDQMMADFPYDNITLQQLSQGGYDGLRQATMNAIESGSTPDLVLGYPDQLLDYENAGALVPLDPYMKHSDFGVDTSDFITGMDDESFSLPFTRTTELIAYNKDYFEAQGYDLEAMGHLHWSDLEAMNDDMVGTGPDQCHKLISMDSNINLFENSVNQWNGSYKDETGQITMDNPAVNGMLDYFQDLMNKDLLTFPSEWDESYGSGPFTDGDVCMTQGSTAGVRYNLTDDFEVGFLPVIQKEDGERSSILQGPDMGIMDDTSHEERMAAWLVMRHLTNSENSAFFSMNSGTMPVRKSAFDDDDYKAFMAIADQPHDDLTPDEKDDYPFAQAANIAESQLEAYHESPASYGRISSEKFSREIERMIDQIYSKDKTVEEAMNSFDKAVNPWGDLSHIEQVHKKLRIDETILSDDIDLPLVFDEHPDVTIDWESSDEKYLDSNGKVTPPEYGDGSVAVTLEATLDDGDDTMTKSFDLTILDPADEENKRLLQEARDRLVLAFQRDNVTS